MMKKLVAYSLHTGERALTGIDAPVLASIFVGDLEHAASDNVDGLSSNNGLGSSS
jgi:hypothetical protein